MLSFLWCVGRDLNPQAFWAQHFKCCVYTDSTTHASERKLPQSHFLISATMSWLQAVAVRAEYA